MPVFSDPQYIRHTPCVEIWEDKEFPLIKDLLGRLLSFAYPYEIRGEFHISPNRPSTSLAAALEYNPLFFRPPSEASCAHGTFLPSPKAFPDVSDIHSLVGAVSCEIARPARMPESACQGTFILTGNTGPKSAHEQIEQNLQFHRRINLPDRNLPKIRAGLDAIQTHRNRRIC